jgi:hypothetical protein
VLQVALRVEEWKRVSKSHVVVCYRSEPSMRRDAQRPHMNAKVGAGAELQKPLALAVIGGLTQSTPHATDGAGSVRRSHASKS